MRRPAVKHPSTPESRFDLGKGVGKSIRLQLGAQLAGDLREREDSAHPFLVRAVFPHQEVLASGLFQCRDDMTHPRPADFLPFASCSRWRARSRSRARWWRPESARNRSSPRAQASRALPGGAERRAPLRRRRSISGATNATASIHGTYGVISKVLWKNVRPHHVSP